MGINLRAASLANTDYKHCVQVQKTYDLSRSGHHFSTTPDTSLGDIHLAIELEEAEEGLRLTTEEIQARTFDEL